ncbi:hypothetical protein LZ32DRAFT_287578 [Colletotrichum eremochloae]|nr:hypothetical protein LZ32DRAFT_287578 [Colletotrichum eremochloae]
MYKKKKGQSGPHSHLSSVDFPSTHLHPWEFQQLFWATSAGSLTSSKTKEFVDGWWPERTNCSPNVSAEPSIPHILVRLMRRPASSTTDRQTPQDASCSRLLLIAHLAVDDPTTPPCMLALYSFTEDLVFFRPRPRCNAAQLQRTPPSQFGPLCLKSLGECDVNAHLR